MLGDFTCGRYRFVLQARTPVRLNAFAGATLRGGFGHVFKQTVCIWPPGDCPRCLLKNTCSYPYIFETAPPPGAKKLRSLDQIPRPFVIEVPTRGPQFYPPGESFAFRLVLVGRAMDYLPYFVFAFRQLGETGLGPGRGQYTLSEVFAETPEGERRIYSSTDGTLHEGGHLRATDVTTPRWAAPPAGQSGRPWNNASESQGGGQGWIGGVGGHERKSRRNGDDTRSPRSCGECP